MGNKQPNKYPDIKQSDCKIKMIRGNKQNGVGYCTFSDGSYYEGYWKDGKRYGKGIETWPNGSFYRGEWKDDMRIGLGIDVGESCHEGESKDD